VNKIDLDIINEKFGETLPEMKLSFMKNILVCSYKQSTINLKVLTVTPGGRLWLQSVIEENRYKKDSLILLADYFNPEICREFKSAGINFLDQCGNIYLTTDNLLVYNIGHRKQKFEKRVRSANLLNKSGLKLVFSLFLDEKLLNFTYRYLGEISKIALGSVKNVLDALRDSGFMIDDSGSKKIINKKVLLDRWIINYQDKLKPDLLIGKFRTLNAEDKLLFTDSENIYLSGEAGAERLTGYLLPETYECYSTLTKAEIIKKFRLIPDESGNVAFYQTFWSVDIDNKNNNLAPALLIYADLLSSNKTRNIETAGIIYDQYLQTEF